MGATPNPATLSRGNDATGIVGALFKDQRQYYVDPYSYSELWQNATPFISRMIERAKVVTNLADPLFKMFEHESPIRKQEAVTSTAGTIPASDTGLTVAFSAVTGLDSTTSTSLYNTMFEIWDATKTTKKGVALVMWNGTNMTAKSMLPSSGPGSGINTDGTIIIVSGDIFVAIGTAYGEGSEAGEAWSDDLRVVFGSTGIHRLPVEITGTLYQASLRGANKELARLRMGKLWEFKVLENKRLMRSKNLIGTNLSGTAASLADLGRTGSINGTSTAAGGKVRTPYGLLPLIEDYGSSDETSDTQNVFDRTSGLKWNQLIDDAEKIFQYQNMDGYREFFAGPRAYGYWSKLADDNGGANRSKTKLGFDISVSKSQNTQADGTGITFRWVETPFGIFRMMLEPSMRFEYSNYMVSPTWSNMYYAVYRDFRWDTAIKDKRFNGYDGIKDEYFSDTGIGATLIKSHCIMKLPRA